MRSGEVNSDTLLKMLYFTYLLIQMSVRCSLYLLIQGELVEPQYSAPITPHIHNIALSKGRHDLETNLETTPVQHCSGKASTYA